MSECFFRVLISNVHKSELSTQLRQAFPGMFLKSFNILAGRVLSGYKATRLRLVALFCLYHDKTLPLVY